MKYFLLVFFTDVFLHSANGTTAVPLKPSWSFHCSQEDGCQRAESLNYSKVINTTLYSNIDLCRMVCGHFGTIWPLPRTAKLGSKIIRIHPKMLRYDVQNVPPESRPILAEMTRVVTANLLAECGGNITETEDRAVVVYITVKTPSHVLNWNTDEMYMLDVQASSPKNISLIYIVAETIFGARHALETFTQLISPSREDYPGQRTCGLYIVSNAKIRDAPVFRHRGFLLDTSRNFFPIKDIKRMIDGLAATKMNVFHWHVTDSHSFPLESHSVPYFTRYGAYSPDEIYTVEMVKDLIQYATIRGVRVVMEIGAPAHAGNGWNWGNEAGLGDLAVCVNAKPWNKYCDQPPCGQLNPVNRALFDILRDLYRDIIHLMPQPILFHMGGDEIFIPCWNSSIEIVEFMNKHFLPLDNEGFIQLWGNFQQKALKIWDEEYDLAGGDWQPPVMVWSSALTHVKRIEKYLDKKRYVIEVRESANNVLLSQLLRLGYRVVHLPKDIWYLNYDLEDKENVYWNWRRMYYHVLPLEMNILGGEVAMWTEYVDSESLDDMVWPRTAAVAERLWADPTSPASAAEPRLQRLRRRLRARGLRAATLAPAWCAQHEQKCN